MNAFLPGYWEEVEEKREYYTLRRFYDALRRPFRVMLANCHNIDCGSQFDQIFSCLGH
jgi:hypothetical protein